MKKKVKSIAEQIAECFCEGGLRDMEIDKLVFWSFRYFLGRRTIHTIFFAKELAVAFPLLCSNIQEKIQKELEEAFERDDELRAKGEKAYLPLGHDCDREAWQKVRDVYSAKIQNDESPFIGKTVEDEELGRGTIIGHENYMVLIKLDKPGTKMLAVPESAIPDLSAKNEND
jgi:hypothetical protein